MFTKIFSDISKKDTAIAGGKGASLGEMTRAGIPVPPGFVVLTAAFERFCSETDITVEIDAALKTIKSGDIHSIQRSSEKIQDIIKDAIIPQDIADEITHAFEALGAPLVAVRSSATAEDSSVASWAGELESYLNVDHLSLLDAVKRCWASLFTPRAIFYRFEKNMGDADVLVAVVIQKMVQADGSGICFTVHPVTEDHNQLVIEAGFGLGEAIVGGMITPDTYIIDKSAVERQGLKADAALLDKNISEQEMMMVRGGGGTKKISVPAKAVDKQKLGDKDIVKLARMCIHIEKHYGKPQDIEWVLRGKSLLIVQSRPITSLRN